MPDRTDPLLRTDVELVEDVLAGDQSAFRVLVERYHDPLFRFLYRLTGNRDLAEDVFQDAFLQVHQSLGTFDRQRQFKPWLFTIAANKGRDALRRANRRATVSLSGSRGDDDAPGFDFADLRGVTPDERLTSEELNRLVQNAVDELPLRLREILLLAYFQKLSYSQMSEAFGIPIGTVKSRLHAAVAAFAKKWQAQLVAFEEGTSRNREPGS